ncbi:MAG: hypothetical protein QG599_1822 [Pseudomonadota bacterium]|nr:hypothetical protein [Pseudomonadota bacterium]
MTTPSHDSSLIPQVETRVDRLTALRGTVFRCIGALGGNADSTSHLVCEALHQVADELGEMIVHETDLNASVRRYRDVEEHLVDIEEALDDPRSPIPGDQRD